VISEAAETARRGWRGEPLGGETKLLGIGFHQADSSATFLTPSPLPSSHSHAYLQISPGIVAPVTVELCCAAPGERVNDAIEVRVDGGPSLSISVAARAADVVPAPTSGPTLRQ